MKKVGFIGMGNMAGAIARGIVEGNVMPADALFAYDILQDKLARFCAETGVQACATPEELVSRVDTVLVAVKPNAVEGALAPLLPLLKGKALLSVALGWDNARYAALLPAEVRHLYIMPNTPAMVGAGVFLLEEDNTLTPEEFEEVRRIFSALGVVYTLPGRLMAVGGTVSACSPAFFAMAVEALADGGVMYGLPRDTAYALAAGAMAGTGRLLLETGLHPGAVKDMVCSPGGTTIRGTAALEKDGMRTAFIDAVKAAME